MSIGSSPNIWTSVEKWNQKKTSVFLEDIWPFRSLLGIGDVPHVRCLQLLAVAQLERHKDIYLSYADAEYPGTRTVIWQCGITRGKQQDPTIACLLVENFQLVRLFDVFQNLEIQESMIWQVQSAPSFQTMSKDGHWCHLSRAKSGGSVGVKSKHRLSALQASGF